MLQKDDFFLELEREQLKFIDVLNKAKKIRFISHLDADGLCSASIVSKLLLRYNKEFHLTVVKQLDLETIGEIEKDEYDTYLFTDIGSGQLPAMTSLLEKARVIVLDHHPFEKNFEHKNLMHINPHKYGIDGGCEMSASTLCYFLIRLFEIKNCEHLAIIGTIGDTQEKNGELNGFNKFVLENLNENIKIKKGLRVFGRTSKPIHKAIAYSTEFIPGISGDESSAIQFLADAGIEIKKDNEFRTISDLSEEEEKNIISNIITRRVNSNQDTNNIVGNSYTVENDNGAVKDAHEFATLLNSCGRQGMPSVGIMLCLGDKNAPKMSKEIIASYRKKILKAINWFKANKENKDKIVETENTLYIKGKDEIDDTMIGTICSIKSSSKDFNKNIIIGFANSTNGVKVSGRVTSKIDLNMGKTIKEIAKLIKGEGGGHEKAGGGKIPFGSENAFIAEFEKTIKNIKG